jgi:hypothetical protein
VIGGTLHAQDHRRSVATRAGHRRRPRAQQAGRDRHPISADQRRQRCGPARSGHRTGRPATGELSVAVGCGRGARPSVQRPAGEPSVNLPPMRSTSQRCCCSVCRCSPRRPTRPARPNPKPDRAADQRTRPAWLPRSLQARSRHTAKLVGCKMPPSAAIDPSSKRAPAVPLRLHATASAPIYTTDPRASRTANKPRGDISWLRGVNKRSGLNATVPVLGVKQGQPAV